MNEKEYYQIVNACYRLIRRLDTPLEWVALPWLHVLNQHPVILANYEDLIEELCPSKDRVAQQSLPWRTLRRWRVLIGEAVLMARNLLHSVPYTASTRSSMTVSDARYQVPIEPHKFDVLIVSWLVHIDHIRMTDDFYFGNLQPILADYGLSSLLVLRNQTGHPTSGLLGRARRDGPCGRLMLPDTAGIFEELGFVRQCVRAWHQMRQAELEAASLLDRQVARKARNLIVSSAVVSNLRLHAQMTNLCRQMRPSVVMALYEGHAWERCVWHAARTSCAPVLCVGYQHTVLRKHAAAKRSLGPDKRYDPDLILTVGDVTRRILESVEELRGTHMITFGTHRRSGAMLADVPRLLPTFLVLPEGIESECIYLFEFALECARRLPEVRFIFRTHPVLPFEQIEPKLRGYHPVPNNVAVSRNRAIEDDFARGGYLLYRGSSTVIYAILAGLKPFYVVRPDEMDIDPVYELSAWRERVNSVEELVAKYQSHQAREGDDSIKEWQRARAFCDEYVQPVREDAIAEILKIAGQTSRRGAKGVPEK